VTIPLRAAAAVLLAVAVLTAPSAAPAEPFLDLFTGKSWTHDADVEISQPGRGNAFTVEDLGFDDESFVSPPYYGFRAGYFFESLPAVGVGVEFIHFKILGETRDTKRIVGTRAGAPIDARVPVNSVVQKFDVSHGVNYVMFDVIGRYRLLQDAERFPHGRVQLHAGAGIGPVISNTSARIDGVTADAGYELAGVGVQGFLGIRALFSRYVGLFAEYKFTRADLEVGLKGGHADVDERSHHIVGGISFFLP